MQVGKFNNARYPNLENGGYIAGERTYIWLSLISKSLILWQVAIAAFSENNETTVADNY